MLHVKPGTVVIPFSSMSKEGRDEIWNLIDSLVFDEETLLAMKQEEEAKREQISCKKSRCIPATQKGALEEDRKAGCQKTKERRDKAKSKKSVNNHKKK